MKKIYTFFIITFVLANISYAQHTIRIELKTDKYGSETTWKVRNSMNNSIIASGGPYQNTSAATLQNVNPINVDGTGCYYFTIYDQYGDGICCTYGNGYFKVFYDDVLIGQGSQFGSEYSIFGMGTGCPLNEVEVTEITSGQYALIHETMPIKGVVKNNGTAPLTSFDVTYKIGDGEYVNTYTKTCNITTGNSIEFTHNIPLAFSANGHYPITVTVSNPNGYSDNTADNSIIHNVIVNKSFVPRRILLEHFTTERCPNCPAAMSNLSIWMSTRQDVVWVAHHAGYYTDQFTLPASESLLVFFNANGGTYAPAIMLDRTYLSPDGNPGPVFFPNTDYTAALIDRMRSTNSFVTVNIEGRYDSSIRKLYVTVSGEFVGDVFGDDLKLSVFLTEDNITSTNQSGYTGTYTHQNLLRAVLSESYQGDSGVVGNGEMGLSFSKTYEYTINPAWVIDNLNVIAFVNNWHPTNVNNRNVLNATKKRISEISNSDNDFISFSFGDLDLSSAVINYTNKTININVQNQAQLDNLTAEFTLSPNAITKINGVEQESSVTTNDFTAPVTYTVIAEDLSEANWTVSVTKEVSANIIGFSFGSNDHTGAIINKTNKTINIVVKNNVDLSVLAAEFTLSDGATAEIGGVLQLSGISTNSFTENVIYTIKSSDNTITNNWTVTTTKYYSADAKIIDYSLAETNIISKEINTASKSINIVVEYNTDLTDLIAEYNISNGATAIIGTETQQSGVTANDFTEPVIYKITAENGTTINNWTVTVNRNTNIGTIEYIDNNVEIFPNPANNILNINYANGANVIIINTLGQEVYFANNASENLKVDVSNFEAGTYFIKIVRNDNIENYKILITK